MKYKAVVHILDKHFLKYSAFNSLHVTNIRHTQMDDDHGNSTSDYSTES